MMVMVYEASLARLQHFRVSYGSVLLKNSSEILRQIRFQIK